MKKMNNKGFMLTETLIVSTLLITVLLIVYMQFKTVNRNISNSFSYNNVSSLYNLYNVKLFIEQENFTSIVAVLDTKDYVDITDCSNVYFNNENYCKNIISTASITQLIVAKENLYSIIQNKPFDESMNDYISKITYETKEGYRLIASFSDGTYASVKLLNDDKFDSMIANSCVSSIKKKYTINYLLDEDTIYKEPLVDVAGCGETIDVSSKDTNTNSCYYVSSYSTDTLKISELENTNNASIYYKKYTSSLTIQHKSLSGTTLATDTIVNGDCGEVIYPENYKRLINNYNYSNASSTEVVMTKNNTTVILYYAEGSASNE